MLLKLLCALIAGLVIGGLVMYSTPVQTKLSMLKPWKERHAEAKGQLLASYGFPYVFNYFLLNEWGSPATEGKNSIVSDTLNKFGHTRELLTADYRNGGSPNNDTLYSVAWMYVEKEPIILTVPPADRADRYWTVQIASFESDTYTYVGMRTTGMDGGSYAIVPPGWRGVLPEGVELLAEAPTRWSFLLGRILADGPQDYKVAHTMQDQFRLTALSNWGASEHQIPYYPPVDTRFAKYRKMFADRSIGIRGLIKKFIAEDSQPYFDIMRHAMTLSGIPADERFIQYQFEEVGLTLDEEIALDPSTLEGRNRGLSLGLLNTIKAMKDNYLCRIVNGWRITKTNLGRLGDDGDYHGRAALQSLGGIVANDPEEAVYLVLTLDPTQEGSDRPDGSKYSYKVHFDKEQLPNVKAFWSMTAYDTTNNFVINDYNRYSIGDRTESLQYDEEGGLTIYMSAEEPRNKSLKGNWLPIPEAGYYLIFRAYLPGKEIVEGRWAPAPLQLWGNM